MIPPDWIVQVMQERDNRGLGICKLIVPLLEWDSSQMQLHGARIRVSFSFDQDVSVMAIFYEDAPLYLHVHWSEWKQMEADEGFPQWWQLSDACCGLDIRLTYPSRVYILDEHPLDPLGFDKLTKIIGAVIAEGYNHHALIDALGREFPVITEMA